MAKKNPVAKTAPAVKPAPVVKTVPAAKSVPAKTPALKAEIDHPLEGETMRPGQYSVRLSAPAEAQVQVRLDGGEWTDCREAVGFRWLDFTPAIGLVKIEVRARVGKGRWTAPVARTCVVA